MPDSHNSAELSASLTTAVPPEWSDFASSIADRYRIKRQLGAGGMAIVFLAEDVKHARNVALKVLRPELSAILGGERFLQEIRTTANLQHPHILPLHDSGETEGLVFYVMPFVEGESLRDRLERERQLPVDEAIRIGREVAGALDYAHRHGVVHRDIKPENILLHDGQALVADFGIALAAARSEGGVRMTETGLSLGTPQYMSPEQAMGERVITGKADVFALGCVVYEMLVGEPPFTGPTAQAIVARIVTEEPRSLTMQRRTIPPHVESAIRTALQKLPADRFASARDFSEALDGRGSSSPARAGEGGLATPGAVPGTIAFAARGSRVGWRLATFGALGVAIVALAFAAWALLRPAVSPPPSMWALAFSQREAPNAELHAIPSPDGSSIVYVGPERGNTSAGRLWIKHRDRYDAVPVPGTEGVLNFTFSPDGEWIAYEQDGALRKVSLRIGTVMSLADSVAPAQPGIAWLDDGTIVFTRVGGRALKRVAAAGGVPTTIFGIDSGIIRHPAPLPGSGGVLFIKCRASCDADQDLWVLDLKTMSARLLQSDVTNAHYVATGDIAFVRSDGTMLAIGFDAKRLAIEGAPVSLMDSVAISAIGSDALFDVSRSGLLVARLGTSALGRGMYEMVWVDRAGRETQLDSAWQFRLGGFAQSNAGWAISPDGSRLAIAIGKGGGADIWVKRLPNGPASRVTFDSAGSVYRPRFSPDGRWILYVRDAALYRIRVDGTGSPEQVLGRTSRVYEGAWSADGKWLVSRIHGGPGAAKNRDIMAMRVGVDSAATPIIDSPYEESAFALSGDGKWIAYESDETGRKEIYLRPFPDARSGKWQVSTSGGMSPLWSRDSRELIYLTRAQQMVSVRVSPGPAFSQPATWFRMTPNYYGAEGETVEYYTPWDIGRDGNAILMAKRVTNEKDEPSNLVVVESWLEQVRRRTGRR